MEVGGNSIIFFMSGKWRLNDEEVTDERCYDAVEVDEEARIPPSRWVKVNARYGAAPSLSLGTGRDLQVGDSVVLEKHSRSIDWSGCPEDDSSRRFSFSAPKTVTVHRLQGEWFYPAEFRTLVAPVAALGSVNFFGQAHRIEAEEEMMTSASSGERCGRAAMGQGRDGPRAAEWLSPAGPRNSWARKDHIDPYPPFQGKDMEQKGTCDMANMTSKPILEERMRLRWLRSWCCEVLELGP